jgi:hypothetical protein
VTERYTKAIEQLGSDKLDVRIGGIYALERVARDSAKDHPTVIEVLSAFIREHSREIRSASELPVGQALSIRPDVAAALRVIVRRNPQRDENPVDLTEAELPSAMLEDASLAGARLPGVNLERANLRAVWFEGADLRATDLTGADLEAAKLSYASLEDADLRGALLVRVKAIGTSFVGANLAGADMSGANFSDADFHEADLSDADFSGSTVGQTTLLRRYRDGSEAYLFQMADRELPAGWTEDPATGRLTRSPSPA